MSLPQVNDIIDFQNVITVLSIAENPGWIQCETLWRPCTSLRPVCKSCVATVLFVIITFTRVMPCKLYHTATRWLRVKHPICVCVRTRCMLVMTLASLPML